MTANYRPTPIQFGNAYEVGKMRRLAQQVTDLGNTLASIAKATTSGSVPGGGTSNQVLTWLPATNAPGWAPAQVPTSFPYSSLTGVPASFPPAQHLIASPTALGPAHTVQAAGPGAVLKSLGTSTAAFQKLNYAELGDVDITGLADGFVPTWSNLTGKWEMAPPGGGFSGLTPGTVYTATSPTAAQFLPLTFPQVTGTATPAQLGLGTPQYGLGDAITPLVNPAGKLQWAQLNEPASNDSLLTGDGYWKPIRDIEISWSQITDVPHPFTQSGGALAPGVTSPFYGNLVLSPGSAGNGLTIFAWPGQYAAAIYGSQAIGLSNGLFIAAGTNASDAPFFFQNRARTATYAIIFGDGHFTLGYNGTGPVLQSNAAGTLQVLAAASGQTLQVNSNILGQGFAVNAQNGSGFPALISLYSNVTNRWQIAKAADAETGSNAGSTFQINAFADAGTFLGSPLQISRPNGEVIITPYATVNVNGLVVQCAATGTLSSVLFTSSAGGVANFVMRGNNSASGFVLQSNGTSQAVLNQREAADILFQFNAVTVGDWSQSTGQLLLTSLSAGVPGFKLQGVTSGIAGMTFAPGSSAQGFAVSNIIAAGTPGSFLSDAQTSDLMFRLSSPNNVFRFSTNGSTTNFLISATGLTLDQPLLGQMGAGTVNVSGGYYVNGVNIFKGFQGTPTWQQVVAHVCAEWRRSGTFLIYGSFTVAQVGAAVLIHQSGGSPEDENAQMVCTGYIRDTRTMVVRWISVGGPIFGSRAFSYLIAPAGTPLPPIRQAPVIPTA